MGRSIDASEVHASIAGMVSEFGLPVTLAQIDTGLTVKTRGAFFSVAVSPKAGKSALIQNQQTTMYLVPGRIAPKQGDFVTANKQQYRVMAVETRFLYGKPLVYVLELT